MFADIPQITCLSQDIEADLGDSFRITCKVKANPQPRIAWFSVDRNETVNGENNGGTKVKTMFKV